MTLRKPGLLTSGEIDAERLVGPIAPATKRGRSGVSASTSRAASLRQPRALAVQLVGERLHAVVGLGDRGRGEGVGLDDVGAGAEIRGVDRLIASAGSGSGGRCCRGGRAASRRSAPRKSASLSEVWIIVPIARRGRGCASRRCAEAGFGVGSDSRHLRLDKLKAIAEGSRVWKRPIDASSWTPRTRLDQRASASAFPIRNRMRTRDANSRRSKWTPARRHSPELRSSRGIPQAEMPIEVRQACSWPRQAI